MLGESSVVATYTVAGGVVSLFDETGAPLNPLSGSITIDANGNPTVASYNGNDYTLSVGTPVLPEGTQSNPIEITLPALGGLILRKQSNS